MYKLATGRNFADCSPVKGSFRGPANQHLSVFVSVDYEDGQIFSELNKVDLTRDYAKAESPHFSPSATAVGLLIIRLSSFVSVKRKALKRNLS